MKTISIIVNLNWFVVLTKVAKPKYYGKKLKIINKGVDFNQLVVKIVNKSS